jgi:tetratricopeptide (TPR) repeat protein
MAAFRQAVAKLQEGQREEAMIGLEFVLRLDPTFKPATNLRQQLGSGAQEIDLTDIIGQLQAPATETIDGYLIEAVESFNQRNFLDAKAKVEQVLLELPGHEEARQLQRQIDDALKVEIQVGQFLAQAREALDQSDPQEAANFVMMAQALDPHHSGIAPTLQEIHAAGGVPDQRTVEQPSPVDTVAFETSDQGPEVFAAEFDEADQPQASSQPPTEESAAQPAFEPPVDTEPEDASPLWEAVEPAEFSIAPELPQEGIAPPPSDQEPESEPPPVDDVAGLFADEPVPTETPAADDISDLFDAGGEEAPAEANLSPEELRAQELLRAGEAAFTSGNFMAAMDSWSRVYLIDPANIVVSPRIEEARQRLEETERRIEHLLFEAREASELGDEERTTALLDEVLTLHPRHPEAIQLRQDLGLPVEDHDAQAEATTPQMPELDADLFDEQMDDAAAQDLEDLALEWDESGPRRVLGLPFRTAAIIGGAVGVLALAIVLLSGTFFGSKDQQGGDVYQLRANAEELFQQGQVEDALRLVEEFTITDPAAEEPVISRLIERYQRALAPPTPTPIPTSVLAANALNERGLWLHAYLEAVSGLAKSPKDPTLEDIKNQVEQGEPQVSILATSLANSNYQTAVSIASDLLAIYPEQPDVEEVLERSMFNAALAELRAYNLTGAEGYLRQLDERQPDDEVVDRILEFIEKYKARPVDMQLQVFIGSIEQRERRDLLAADPSPKEPLDTREPSPAATMSEEAA